jgi:hypothetical protein
MKTVYMSFIVFHYKLTGLYIFFQTDWKILLKINYNTYMYLGNQCLSPVNLMSLILVHVILCDGDYESEWLLFNANSTIYQLYHGENKLIFNEMMMKSALF